MMLIFKLIVGVIIVVLVLGVVRTWHVQHDARQKEFLAGSVPSPLPDGFYNGSVPGHTFSWLGKKFDGAQNAGINVFKEGSGESEKYPFKTFMAKGLRDQSLDVLAIEYNILENPFWLRPIRDEIVEVAPGHYLGKLLVRIIPGYPFAIAYFELKK